jgi:hypothetical protein
MGTADPLDTDQADQAACQETTAKEPEADRAASMSISLSCELMERLSLRGSARFGGCMSRENYT